MRDQEAAAPTTAASSAAPATEATPGKQALTDNLSLLEGQQQITGSTVFAGPDEVRSEAPPPAKNVPAPAKTDADYEAAFKVKDAITAGKMTPVAAANGKSFVASGIGGKPAAKITFTFDRAFVGDYDYPAAPGKVVRGVHVSIGVHLDGCGSHPDIKMVQVVRNVKKDGGGNMVTAPADSPERIKRAGDGSATAKSKGWFVDGTDTDTTPFYVNDDLYGTNGSSTKDSRLRDTPGHWNTSTNIGREFRTCAVSYAGGKGTVLAYVEWGYYIDASGTCTFTPTPVAHAGSATEIKDAADRWDSLPGLTKGNIQ